VGSSTRLPSGHPFQCRGIMEINVTTLLVIIAILLALILWRVW
jgi:hypothetical protein